MAVTMRTVVAATGAAFAVAFLTLVGCSDETVPGRDIADSDVSDTNRDSHRASDSAADTTPGRDIPLPDCVSRSVCDSSGCRIQFSVSSDGKQKFKIVWEDEPPPTDFRGDLLVRQPELGKLPPKFLTQWWRLGFPTPDTEGSKSMSTSISMFEGTYDVAWWGWPDLAGSSLDPVRIERRGVSLPRDSTLEIRADDPPSTDVQGRIEVDGTPISDRWSATDHRGAYPHWFLTFRDAETGKELREIDGTLEEDEFSTKLYPTHYDVELRLEPAPRNPQIRPGFVAGGIEVARRFDAENEQTLDVSLRTHRIHGTARIDGSRIPELEVTGHRWQLVFVNDSTGAVHRQKIEGGGPYETWMYPGTYDVYLERKSPGGWQEETSAPSGPLEVATGLKVNSDRSFDFNIETTSATFDVAWNGEPVADKLDTAKVGELQLVSTTASIPVTHTATFGPSYVGSEANVEDVVPGTYDVWGQLPAVYKSHVLLAESVDISGDSAKSHPVEFQTVEVPVEISIGGSTVDELDVIAPTPELTFEYATNKEPPAPVSTKATFMRTHLADGVITLYRETYNLAVYRSPVNDGRDLLARRFDWEARPGAALDFRFPTRTLEIRANWNGKPIPVGEEQVPEWELHFRDRTSGRIFARTFAGGTESVQTEIYPGVYDVLFRFIEYDLVPDQPYNRRTLVSKCVPIQ